MFPRNNHAKKGLAQLSKEQSHNHHTQAGLSFHIASNNHHTFVGLRVAFQGTITTRKQGLA